MKPILITLLIFISCFKSYSDSGSCFLMKVQIETKSEVKTGYINLVTLSFINMDSLYIKNYLLNTLKSIPETKDIIQLYKYIVPIHIKGFEQKINYISFDDVEKINTSEIKTCTVIENINCDVGDEVTSYLKQSDSAWVSGELIEDRTLVNGVCKNTFLLYNTDKASLEFFEKIQVAFKQENRKEYDSMLEQCRNYKVIIISLCTN